MKPRIFRLADGTLATVETTDNGTIIVRSNGRTISVLRRGSL